MAVLGFIFFAATLPELRPVEELLPPVVREQTVIIILLAVLAGGFGWWCRQRRKSAVLTVSPGTSARTQLQELEKVPESSQLAGQVLLAIRQYIPAALGWPSAERTTDELLLQLQAEKNLPETLKAEITGLLQVCERRQFSCQSPVAIGQLASRALAVVLKIETLEFEAAQLQNRLEPARRT